jgi:GTP-binding protein HflX
MFATLDPTIRSIMLPSRRKVLLSDTVGFVRNLPTTLIEAFRATLEEVADAALILHVVDVSSEQAEQHVAEVFRVLGEIGAASTPQILVLNKADRLPAGEHDVDVVGARLLAGAGPSPGAQDGPVGLCATNPLIPAVMVSGLTGEGLTRLLDVIDLAVPFDALERVRFRIPLRDGAAIALLHEHGRVRAEDYHGNLCELEVDAPESLRRRLRRYLIENSTSSVENSVYK